MVWCALALSAGLGVATLVMAAEGFLDTVVRRRMSNVLLDMLFRVGACVLLPILCVVLMVVIAIGGEQAALRVLRAVEVRATP